MHICYLNMPIEYYSPVSGGAIATIIMQQARQLISRGHDVTILTVRDENEIYDVGRVVPIIAPRRHELSLASRGMSKIRRNLAGWDYAYYEHYRDSFIAALISLKPRPDVVVIHNDLVSARYIRQALPQARIVCALQNEQRTAQHNHGQWIAAVDHFLACSAYIRDWLLRTYPIPPRQVDVILNGVDPDSFYPRLDFLEARNELNVLFIGRTNWDKGADLVPDAVAALRQEGLAVKLAVAGAVWFYNFSEQDRDPYFIALQGKMKAAGAEYAGMVTRSKVPKLIREQDVVCVPSRWNDPCPLVLAEAMASGCAVIGSNRGGIAEMCGGAAIIIDPDHPGAVTVSLRHLATTPLELRSRKLASVERSRHCSWSQNVDRLELIFAGQSPSDDSELAPVTDPGTDAGLVEGVVA